MDPEDSDRNQCKVQLEVLNLLRAIPNQFFKPLLILCHLDNLILIWRVAIQEGCQIHHWYHCNLVLRNYLNCQIQMCPDLEKLNLKVVMMGVETGVKMIGKSCGDGSVMDFHGLDYLMIMEGEVIQVNMVIAVRFEQQNQDDNLSNLHCVHL